jgi:hypothetical protein
MRRSALAQQLRQLHDVEGDPPRLGVRYGPARPRSQRLPLAPATGSVVPPWMRLFRPSRNSCSEPRILVCRLLHPESALADAVALW